MKLTVLGGSAAGPNPGQGCSGYLVASGQTRLVLDLGPGTLPELRMHADFREIDAYVLSHLHLDHSLDILALRYALAYNPIRPARQIPLFLPPGGLAFLGRLAMALGDSPLAREFFNVFAAQEYDPAAELAVGDLSLRFHPTVHYVPCWAMRVCHATDGDLVYTADTGPAADLAPFARDCEVMIAEGTVSGEPDEPFALRGHMTPREAGALARRARAGRLVLTHLWTENDPALAQQEAAAAYGGPVERATPGLQLTWPAPTNQTTGSPMTND
jgi:ribonuclease BN (tRNA processing enzyme)